MKRSGQVHPPIIPDLPPPPNYIPGMVMYIIIYTQQNQLRMNLDISAFYCLHVSLFYYIKSISIPHTGLKHKPILIPYTVYIYIYIYIYIYTYYYLH